MMSTKQIVKRLASFSIPLILSGVMQQLFHWVDALIIGNILGETALAGVGATSSLYNLFVRMLAGFTSGLAVLFAQQYGSGNKEDNTRLLANYSVLLTGLFTIIAIAGMVLTEPILNLMDTPVALFDYARDYLLIVFAGIPFIALYNTYSAVIHGMGNSKVPLAAVLISSVINVVLDYIFIAFFHTGVSGAAAATVISQIVMAVYIIIFTVRKHPELRFSLLRLKQYRGMLKTGGKYGMPPAAQGTATSVGNLFLQKFMNGFGEKTVAAITTAYRVDAVLFLPIINFSTAISTLVAQETGANNEETAKKIFKIGTGMMTVIATVLALVIVLLGKVLLSMFGLTQESVAVGETFFRTIAGFYIIYGLSMSFKGYLDGVSDLLFTGMVGIFALGVRIISSYCFVGIWGNAVVAYAEGFSWIFMLVVFIVRYWRKVRKE